MFIKLSLLLLLSSCVFAHDEANVTVVNTSVGQIQGIVGKDFTMFLGIPYGVVDEKNPFRAATPHPPFVTPWAAFNDSAVCPQYDKGVIKGTIHCLHLNVYTPTVVSPTATLPVMVFIHGGAFKEGNGALSTYSPIFLMRHDVILVTVNYRLGPYGHLCLPNTEYSNQALKDQLLALKWVKNNIKSFGGDNDNILFFGHSSGSLSVEYHLLYNNDNLFNKVILQSGQIVSPLMDQVTNTETFMKDVGMDSENIDVDRFIQIISAMDHNELINITKDYDFRPCVDGIFINGTPKKNLQDIKIMIGGTTKETLYLFKLMSRVLYSNYDFAKELGKGFTNVTKDATDFVENFYCGHYRENIIDFTTDFEYNYPMERAVRYYVESNSTVYRYLFSYDGGRNYMQTRESIISTDSTHADELGYLFDMPLFRYTNRKDQVVVDRVTELWTNFAKYGNPTPLLNDSPLLPVTWTPVTAGTMPYLNIDEYLSVKDRPFQKNMAFWDLFYEHYGMYAKGMHLGEKWRKYTERCENKGHSQRVADAGAVPALTLGGSSSTTVRTHDYVVAGRRIGCQPQ